jgi:hypothetical protein
MSPPLIRNDSRANSSFTNRSTLSITPVVDAAPHSRNPATSATTSMQA